MKRNSNPFARVDKALSVFRSAAEELEAAARTHDELADQHSAAADVALARGAEHRVAASAAFKTASKITEFLP